MPNSTASTTPVTARPRAAGGPIRRAVAAFAAATMLASCAGGLTREGRIGPDDGTDSCRPQLVALDSTGNFFAEDILRGAAIGALGGAAVGGIAGGNWRSALIGAGAGAAVGAAGGYLAALQGRNQDQASLGAALASDLDRENAELARTQLAFDQLMECRFGRARAIRADLRDGRLPRPAAEAQMADLRARTERDIQLAQTINGQISQRGAEFDTAIDTVAPGARSAAVASAASGRTAPPPRGTGRGRGRTTAAPVQPASAAPSGGGDVRSLAATNIARRDSFSNSVGQAQAATAAGRGFELAS